jgi:predicted amidohydrolase YtcJ
MAAIILSMDFITPFDWRLPGRAVQGVRGEAGYRAALAALVGARDGAADGWVRTWGFHHYFHGALDRRVLDAICPDRPLLVWHRSFHEIFLNRRATLCTGIALRRG